MIIIYLILSKKQLFVEVTDPPSWLGPENKNWKGNYKVKYWEDGWWDTAINQYLDRIEEADFDGVYLDIIDGYYYWGNHGYGMKKSKKAAYLNKAANQNFSIIPYRAHPDRELNQIKM